MIDFLAWKRTDGLSETCCGRATDEEIEHDEDGVYDCATCELRLRTQALTEHDITAMLVHRLLSGPAVERFHLTPLVFDVLGLRMTMPEALMLVEKLNIIEADLQDALEEQRETGRPTREVMTDGE